MIDAYGAGGVHGPVPQEYAALAADRINNEDDAQYWITHAAARAGTCLLRGLQSMMYEYASELRAYIIEARWQGYKVGS